MIIENPNTILNKIWIIYNNDKNIELVTDDHSYVVGYLENIKNGKYTVVRYHKENVIKTQVVYGNILINEHKE